MKEDMIRSNQLFSQYIKMNIVDQGIAYGDKHWLFSQIISPFHRIYYIAQGCIYVKYKGETYTFSAGEFIFLKRDTVMDYYARGDFLQYYVHIQYQMVGGLDVLDKANTIVRLKVDNSMKEKFLAMFTKNSVIGFAKGTSALYDVLAEVLTSVKEPDEIELFHINQYVPLLHHIERHTDVSMTVASMAKKCDQSISDFSRKFKKIMNLSPKAYLHQVVLEKSQVLLATTNLSINEISSNLGFNDSLYFSRFFKKYATVSPSIYRKSQI